RRASLHRRAADALMRLYSDRAQEPAAAIAYHLVNGGAEPASIAHYAELAGDRAYALSAYPEAVRHYKLALDNIGTLADSASADDHLRLANLLERLGECARVLGNYEEACGYFERAIEVREQYRKRSSQLDSQFEAQIDALLNVEIGITWYDRGENTCAMESYTFVEKMLNGAGIETGPAWASLYLHKSYILWQEGSFEQARQYAQQALIIFERLLEQRDHVAINAFHSTAIRRRLEGDPVDLGRTHRLLGTIAAITGQSINALEHQNTALAIFERYERQREISIVCCNIGDIYLQQAKYTDAQASLRRSLAIAEQIGEVSIESMASGNLGIIAVRLGSMGSAETYFRRGLALAEQVHDPVYISFWNNCLAMVVQNQGRFDDARKSLVESIKIGRAIKFVPSIGYVLVAIGQLRIVQALNSQLVDNH